MYSKHSEVEGEESNTPTDKFLPFSTEGRTTYTITTANKLPTNCISTNLKYLETIDRYKLHT